MGPDDSDTCDDSDRCDDTDDNDDRETLKTLADALDERADVLATKVRPRQNKSENVSESDSDGGSESEDDQAGAGGEEPWLAVFIDGSMIAPAIVRLIADHEMGLIAFVQLAHGSQSSMAAIARTQPDWSRGRGVNDELW